MKIYHRCLICLGSNFEREIHLNNAGKSLQKLFPDIVLGKMIFTEAEGDIPQPAYINQAAVFHTDLSAEKVVGLLKNLERENGRTRFSKDEGKVPLDIDLLTYDNNILKPSDLEKSFVRQAVRMIPGA